MDIQQTTCDEPTRFAGTTNDAPGAGPAPCLSPLPGNAMRRWVYRIAAIVVVLLAGELILRLASIAYPSILDATNPAHSGITGGAPRIPIMVPDPLLRHRGNPVFPTHDRFGYHNKVIPSEIDIVALGDSQTYGPIGRPTDAWPAVVGRSTRRSVYNMGIGGWDSVEYLTVLEEAIERKPVVILLGLYLGNDIYGAYRAVHLNHVDEELATVAMIEPLAALERRDPFTERISYLVQSWPESDGEPAGGAEAPGVRRLLSERSRLYGALRWMKNCSCAWFSPGTIGPQRNNRVWAAEVEWAHRHPDRTLVINRDGLRTILTPDIRALVMDTTDPRVTEGLAITLRVLARCSARCRAQRITFAVLLIPTKESVFAKQMASESVPPRLRRVIRVETQLRRHLIDALADEGVPNRDTLPALVAAVANGRRVYSLTRDGHPTPEGHRVIASEVEKLLAQWPTHRDNQTH